MAAVFASGIASLERVLELLDGPEVERGAGPDDDGTPALRPTRGRIEFERRPLLLPTLTNP